MKKFRFTMGTLILAMMATTFMACNKEKESSVVQQTTGTEDVVRKPIATFDKKKGGIIYHVFPDHLQRLMSLETSYSKSFDKYIISSLEIVDGLSYTDAPILKIVILDTENETSNSVFLLDIFVTSEDNEDYVCYYLSENVKNGQYSFASQSEEDGCRYLLTIENAELTIS